MTVLEQAGLANDTLGPCKLVALRGREGMNRLPRWSATVRHRSGPQITYPAQLTLANRASARTCLGPLVVSLQEREASTKSA